MKSTVQRNGQVTIPDDARRAARLDEGDSVEIEVVEGGLLLRRSADEQDPPYYGTPEWEEKLQEAIDDVEAGRTTLFDSEEEFLASLK